MRGRVAFLDRTQNHQNKPRKCVRSSSRLEFRLLSVGRRKFLPCCGPLRLEPISIRRRPWSGVSGTRPEVGVGRVGDRGPVPLVGAGRVGVAGRDARYRSGSGRGRGNRKPRPDCSDRGSVARCTRRPAGPLSVNNRPRIYLKEYFGGA